MRPLLRPRGEAAPVADEVAEGSFRGTRGTGSAEDAGEESEAVGGDAVEDEVADEAAEEPEAEVVGGVVLLRVTM